MNLFSKKRIKRHGYLMDRPVDGGEGCRDCAADCCRGFPSVRLTAEEYRTLEQLGAARLEFLLNGEHYLLIEYGCEFLENNRCRIYSQRPSVCRRFSCGDIEK